MIQDVPDTRKLFSEITESFIVVLESITDEQWNAKTCYPNWKVKDIIAHLIQTAISRLSGQRDKYVLNKGSDNKTFEEISLMIDAFNTNWQKTFSLISPKVILSIFEVVERELLFFLEQQDLDAKAYYPVSWAGEMNSINRFDIF